MEGSKRVAVTGAGGKLGSLVFMKLLGAQPTGLQPVGVVRSEQVRPGCSLLPSVSFTAVPSITRAPCRLLLLRLFIHK